LCDQQSWFVGWDGKMDRKEETMEDGREEDERRGITE